MMLKDKVTELTRLLAEERQKVTAISGAEGEPLRHQSSHEELLFSMSLRLTQLEERLAPPTGWMPLHGAASDFSSGSRSHVEESLMPLSRRLTQLEEESFGPPPAYGGRMDGTQQRRQEGSDGWMPKRAAPGLSSGTLISKLEASGHSPIPLQKCMDRVMQLQNRHPPQGSR